VKSDYLRCPNCQRKLKERCYSCGKAVDPEWKLCPYCEAEMGAAPAPTGSRRRRRAQPATAEGTAAAEAPTTTRSKR
jgi:hypothetical protein